jgi:8-oxo-dGTP pyrophosphatase MutT (NUDIX family)
MALASPSPSFTYPSSLSAFAISVKEYLSLHPEFEGIAAGAVVFDKQNRLLILQRAPYDSMPNLWEVPGGACDFEDESILHGISREVWEESGLKVTALKRQVGATGGPVFFTTTRGLKVCKFTFEAEVESTEVVKLDPNEHQRYLWVSEEECRSHRVERDGALVEIKFTRPAQEETVLAGFRLRDVVKSDRD